MTTVVLPIPRVECPKCGLVRQVKIAFADPRRSYTKAFERYVLELSRRMTIRDVARHLNVGWDLIKDIQKRDLSRRYPAGGTAGRRSHACTVYHGVCRSRRRRHRRHIRKILPLQNINGGYQTLRPQPEERACGPTECREPRARVGVVGRTPLNARFQVRRWASDFMG
jgi:hypothetical protein